MPPNRLIYKAVFSEPVLKESKLLQQNTEVESMPKTTDIQEMEEPNGISLENAAFKICPDCQNKSLKTENGCDSCVTCGYSKCDK